MEDFFKTESSQIKIFCPPCPRITGFNSLLFAHRHYGHICRTQQLTNEDNIVFMTFKRTPCILEHSQNHHRSKIAWTICLGKSSHLVFLTRKSIFPELLPLPCTSQNMKIQLRCTWDEGLKHKSYSTSLLRRNPLSNYTMICSHKINVQQKIQRHREILNIIIKSFMIKRAWDGVRFHDDSEIT